MKILSMVLLLIVLVMALGCGNQVEQGQSNLEIQLPELAKQLQVVNSRLTELEEKITGAPYSSDYPFPQSIEGRLKAIESTLFAPSWAPFKDDKISELEKRISAIEDKLGINRFGWP